MERWGLTYERLQRAVARGDLRPHERLRAQRPARRVPQLRPGGAGGERAVVHQRAARARAVGLGPVVHGQPGGVLQLGGAADGASTAATRPARAPRSTCRRSRPASTSSGRCCSTSRVNGHSTRAPGLPDRQPPGVAQRRAARRLSLPRRRPLGGHRRVRRRRSGPAWSRPSADPTWAGDARFATQDERLRQPGPPRRAHRRVDRGAATATRSTELLQAAGVPAGAVQNAEDLNETDPQIAAPRRVLRDGPSGDRPGPLRGQPDARSPRPRPDNWRSAPLLGEDNAYVFKDIARDRRRRVRRADGRRA